jgi:hypothetical protein
MTKLTLRSQCEHTYRDGYCRSPSDPGRCTASFHYRPISLQTETERASGVGKWHCPLVPFSHRSSHHERQCRGTCSGACPIGSSHRITSLRNEIERTGGNKQRCRPLVHSSLSRPTGTRKRSSDAWWHDYSHSYPAVFSDNIGSGHSLGFPHPRIGRSPASDHADHPRLARQW